MTSVTYYIESVEDLKQYFLPSGRLFASIAWAMLLQHGEYTFKSNNVRMRLVKV